MNRQEYEFLELAGRWGKLSGSQKHHIVGYVRHKRAAGFGLVIPLAALAFVLTQLLRFVH